jgi:BMFP domain-containing protein YqiC
MADDAKSILAEGRALVESLRGFTIERERSASYPPFERERPAPLPTKSKLRPMTPEQLREFVDARIAEREVKGPQLGLLKAQRKTFETFEVVITKLREQIAELRAQVAALKSEVAWLSRAERPPTPAPPVDALIS